MKINIVVFEDSTKVRESIALRLATDPEISLIGMFSHVRNFQQQVLSPRPDVVLIDMDMPGKAGLKAARWLKEEWPAGRVIMLTAGGEKLSIHDAIDAGASGCLLKDELSDCLISAIKESNSGGSPMSPLIARKVWEIVQQTLPCQPKSVIAYGLSKRETEILGCIVHGSSYKMIAAELFIAYETVRSHMKSIYVKLDVASLTAAVAKAIHEKVV